MEGLDRDGCTMAAVLRLLVLVPSVARGGILMVSPLVRVSLDRLAELV